MLVALAMAAITPPDITGLILCGGRGSRMGGVDKGLQQYRGQALATHALRRLRPQVGHLSINANRNLAAYQAMGVPVWPDALPDGVSDYPGPLAGLLAGLQHCETPYLVCVPCDTPHFPTDLVERLSQALAREDADIAMAASLADGVVRSQPVFCLLKIALTQNLADALRGGERKIDRWISRHRRATVVFDNADHFFNANTAADLQQLAAARGDTGG